MKGAGGKRMKEYLRRNLLHAKAVGVEWGIRVTITRLSKAKRTPKWLLDGLHRDLRGALDVRHEMARHRDEVKPRVLSHRRR